MIGVLLTYLGLLDPNFRAGYTENPEMSRDQMRDLYPRGRNPAAPQFLGGRPEPIQNPRLQDLPVPPTNNPQQNPVSPGLLGGNKQPTLMDTVGDFLKGFIPKNADEDQYNDSKVLLEKAEGNHPYYYLDTQDKWTSGLGHTSTHPPGKYNRDYKKIVYRDPVDNIGRFVATDMSGKIIEVDKTEVDRRYRMDYNEAVKDARNHFGKEDFDNLPMKVKSGLISVSFNSGLKQLKGFTRLKDAVSNFSRNGTKFEDIPLNLLYIEPHDKENENYMKFTTRFNETGKEGGRTAKELKHMMGH